MDGSAPFRWGRLQQNRLSTTTVGAALSPNCARSASIGATRPANSPRFTLKQPEATAIRTLSPAHGFPVRGFTLLELVITVSIVGILAAIALPSYSSYLRKSARAEAQSFLTDAASRQQQFLVDRRAYATSIANLNVTPPSDLAAKFTFAVATADGPPPTFTLTAQAIGDQVKDQCPTLTLGNTGNRTPATCW